MLCEGHVITGKGKYVELLKGEEKNTEKVVYIDESGEDYMRSKNI